MTPQEKAEELINNLYEINCKFFKVSTSEERFARYNTLMPLCIKSAIFAVDEILKVLFQHHEIDYWKEVKQEIEKQNINN